MEVAAVSSRPAAPAAAMDPPIKLHDLGIRDCLERRQRSVSRYVEPAATGPWRQELSGAWYITKLMALTALSTAASALSHGWDSLRAKFSPQD